MAVDPLSKLLCCLYGCSVDPPPLPSSALLALPVAVGYRPELEPSFARQQPPRAPRAFSASLLSAQLVLTSRSVDRWLLPLVDLRLPAIETPQHCALFPPFIKTFTLDKRDGLCNI